MRKRIKNFLEILKFVGNYQRFLSKIFRFSLCEFILKMKIKLAHQIS